MICLTQNIKHESNCDPQNDSLHVTPKFRFGIKSIFALTFLVGLSFWHITNFNITSFIVTSVIYCISFACVTRSVRRNPVRWSIIGAYLFFALHAIWLIIDVAFFNQAGIQNPSPNWIVPVVVVLGICSPYPFVLGACTGYVVQKISDLLTRVRHSQIG